MWDLESKLIECEIVQVEARYVNGVFDFWDVETSRYSMGIYNPVFVSSQDDVIEELSDRHLGSLVGGTITKFVVEEEMIRIHLNNSINIFISTKECDTKSAEAAEVHLFSGEIIIFNGSDAEQN